MSELPLTQHELDEARCDHPNCHDQACAVTFLARCHPRDGTWVTYRRENGVLEITCARCNALIAEVEVAP